MFDIAQFIPYGAENAVTRAYLVTTLGMTDRSVRREIELARNRGAFICNDGEGYFIATEIGEIERQYRVDRARALSTLKRLKAMRRCLRRAGRNVK